MAFDLVAMEKEMAGLVSAVGAHVRAVEELPVEDMSSTLRARNLEGLVKELEKVLGQVNLLKKGCSEKEVELEQRLKDVQKTREELGSIQLGMKEKADSRARIVVLASAQREELALQRGRDAGQRVIELQIELAAERKRRVMAEEEVQCARAEAGIWKGRFREESTRRLGQLILSWRRKGSMGKELLETRQTAKEMTRIAVGWRLRAEGLLRKIASRKEKEEQEALEASIGLEEERQLLSVATRLRERAFERKVSSFQRKAEAIVQAQLGQLHLGGWSGYLLFKLLERMKDLLCGQSVGLVPLVCSDAKLQVALVGLGKASDEFRIASEAAGNMKKAVADVEGLRVNMERLWEAVDLERLIGEAQAGKEEEGSSAWEDVSDDRDTERGGASELEMMAGATAEQSSGPREAAGGEFGVVAAGEEATAPQPQSGRGAGGETGEEELGGPLETGGEEVGDETAVEETSASRLGKEAGDVQQFAYGGDDEGHGVRNGEDLGTVELDGLQKVLASVVWPTLWDNEHRHQLYSELMRRKNAAALSEDEWRTAFEKAVGEGTGACLVPMLVSTIRSGYRMDVRSLKDSRKSCATHGKKVKRAGPCVWVAREVYDGSPRFVIKERKG